MKKIYILVLSVFSIIQSHAQLASAVVFAELGEKFTLYLNGEKQNNTPQSNVKVNNLTGEFYQARVDFEDAKIPDVSNNNFAVQKGVEATYIIKVNKKGEYVLRFHSQAEMSGSSSTAVTHTQPVDQETKRIADVDDQVEDSESVTMNTDMKVTGVDAGATTTVTQTTTTTTKTDPTTKKTTGENIAVGMNVGGVNMGINVNVSGDNMGMDMDMEAEEKVTTTTTTTKTTSTPAKVTPAPSKPKPEPVVEAVPASTGRCASSMSSSSFASAKSNIESKSFEDSKLTIAKQVTKANCLTAAQIKDVMSLFSFEETKLDYAKYAYDFCYNQGDYYEVNDAFTFESSIDDLNKFLESK
jgi:Domain of unknown function (DUF4476)